jgi:DNA-binding transcriptional LysR family regulator
MYSRFRNSHIPIEIARSVVAIAETGSFSKAGGLLGLSQPAISAQIKRAQVLVGGAVFEKQGSGGLNFTPLGQRALSLMRRLLEVNDQIVSLGGADIGKVVLRVGVSVDYVEPFLQGWSKIKPDLCIQIFSNTSTEIAKGLNDGFLDVGCLQGEDAARNQIIDEWEEPFVWARHPQFVTSPGAPIPLVTWPGSCLDAQVERYLEGNGIAYRVAFASQDRQARYAAVKACFGVAAMPLRLVAAPLIEANDYYLPKLSPLRGSIAIRSGLENSLLKKVLPICKTLAASAASRNLADIENSAHRGQAFSLSK